MVTLVTNNPSRSQTVEEGGWSGSVCEECLCVCNCRTVNICVRFMHADGDDICVCAIRMYRRTSNMAGLTYPPTALTALKVKEKKTSFIAEVSQAGSDIIALF